MKDLLPKHQDLLSVVIKAGKKQKKAILDNLEQEQVDFMSQLVYNFLNSFPIEKTQLQKLRKKEKFIDIANFKKTVRHRNRLIKRHKKTLMDLFDKYRVNLITLLK